MSLVMRVLRVSASWPLRLLVLERVGVGWGEEVDGEVIEVRVMTGGADRSEGRGGHRIECNDGGVVIEVSDVAPVIPG